MSRAVTGETLHLRPHAEVAERVLLPGDPGRAMRIAQQLLDTPRMLNHHRGLWGYTGVAQDGGELTVQASGLGGPSAAAVVSDLVALGARRLVRAGTCTALAEDLRLGELLVVDEVLARDGTSRVFGAAASLLPDPALLAGLRGGATGAVLATDFGDRAPAPASALARDLTSAAVLAAAAALGATAAVLLLVAEDAAGARLEDEALHAAELVLGRAALAALSA
jgi:nucleoside phosphorylase